MPTTVSYPGVYIEEIPSGVHTIVGVPTSIAAFIDYFKWGPVDKAVQIQSMSDFERAFGGLDSKSEASYAIQQFYLNGGGAAWVVRVVAGSAAAATASLDATVPASSGSLALEAVSAGAWAGDGSSTVGVRAKIDATGTKANEFNLTVNQYRNVRGKDTVVKQEVFRNLSMATAAPNFVKTVLNDSNSGSSLLKVTGTPGISPPALNGTVSGVPTFPFTLATSKLSVKIGTDTATIELKGVSTAQNDLGAVGPALEAAIRSAFPANPVFAGAAVTIVGSTLVVLAGPGSPKSTVQFTNAGADPTATTLKLTAASGAKENLQEYLLGGGAIASTAQTAGTAGADGDAPDAAALIGNPSTKHGIYALEDVDAFNLLCIPRTAIVGPSPASSDHLDDTGASSVITIAQTYCESRHAFFLMDTPRDIKEPAKIQAWLATHGGLRTKNAAIYYPRLRIPDPIDNFRLRSVGASGTIAGMFAKNDGARGVWKAPAGVETTLRNVAELEYTLTDAENGVLNPLAINCLRNFPLYGPISWGARTLEGADQAASEWKYVPVRRLALFLEESLFRGSQWIVFEPNDEPLWSQIRLNFGAFMQSLFRKGAFQGKTPREAYFVKCDAETTTQNDINSGVVNIVVGFAPLKPAEFVVIKIQQMAGQIET